MQITMKRFSGQTLTANRNVDALRLRGSQGTSAGTLVPTFIHSLNKMSAEVLIAAVTGHPGRVPIPVLSVLRTQNLSTQYVPIQIRRKEVYFKDPDAVLKMG